MHGKQAVIILILLKITCLQTNPLVKILMLEKNFFHKINLQLHVVTNNIFNSLNLTQEFTRNNKVQHLLAMHSDLIKIAEKYSSAYDDIKNMTSSKGTPSTDLHKFFVDVINEEVDILKNSSIKNSTNNNKSIDTSTCSLKKLLQKIDELTINDIIKLSNDKQIKTYAKKHVKSRRTREIKVWKPSASDEEDTDNSTRRIYKGKKTRIKKYPFLVSIHVMNDFTCAGSIISKELVITAATCLQIAYNNSLASNLSRSVLARIGSDYTNHHGELIPITNITFHPDFNPASLQNNLAIIRMMKKVKFSKKRKIQRIKYDRDGDIDDRVTILGWGAKDNNRDLVETHKVSLSHLDIYSMDECKEIYSRYYVTDKNFCAGFVNKGGGACNRDVGGPAVVSGELVGIVSFGPLICGMSDAPTVFTKLSSYADWIDGVIKQKPQMRNEIKSKIRPKNQQAFPLPIFTTSDYKNSVTEKSTKNAEDGYPDEIRILKEILKEIVLSNNSVIDYIIYGDILDKDEIRTTTEKIEIHRQSTNSSGSLVERQKNILPRIMNTFKPVDDVESHSDNNYDEEDTEIKILESLIGFTTFDDKSTPKVRFTVKDNKNPDKTGKLIDSVKYAERSDLDSNEKYIPNDSNSYYDDATGFSIESTKPSVKGPGGKATTNSFKSINLERYNNIVFHLNPLKESRGVIIGNKQNVKDVNNDKNNGYIDLEKTTQEGRQMESVRKPRINYLNALEDATKNNFKREETKLFQKNSKSDDEMTDNQNIRTAEDILGMATEISDDDFEYDVKKSNAHDSNTNMRSRHDDEPLLWRFRSSD